MEKKVFAIDYGYVYNGQVTYVNEKDNVDDTPMMVMVWCGSGYYLDVFIAYCQGDDYEEALGRVMAYCQKHDNCKYLICTDDDYNNVVKDCMKYDGKDEDEAREYADAYFCYVDATWYGGDCAYFLTENLAIYRVDEKRTIEE